MNLRFLAIISFLTILAYEPLASGSVYSKNLQSSEVNAFVQDKDGYIWIATSKGLARFNGGGYQIWHGSNDEAGLINDNIMSLYMGYDGRMWIGTECGITYSSEGQFVKTGEAVYNPVSAITEIGKKHLLVAGKDGLVKFERENLKAVDIFHSDGTSWLDNIMVSSKEEVWFCSNSNDSTFLYTLNSDLDQICSNYLGQHTIISGLCQLSDGNIYVATDKGLYCFDADSRTGGRNLQYDVEVGESKLHFAVPRNNGELLLGVAGRGFYSYNPSKKLFRHIIVQESLSEDRYVCFVDRDDRIWLSDKKRDIRTYNPKGVYVHYKLQSEEKMERVSHLYFDKKGWLWMNRDGILCCMDPATGKIVWKDNGGRQCKVILIDSRGDLWAIFNDNKVCMYSLSKGKPGLVKSIDFKDGAFSLSEDRSGNIWVSSVRQLYIIKRDGSIIKQNPPDNLPFTMMLSDPYTRRLFMFTVSDGVLEIEKNNSYKPIASAEVKGASYVMAASDSTIWIGTYNDGLFSCNTTDGTIKHYGINEGLMDGSIRSIIEDGDGNIWFSTSTSIIKLDRESGSFITIQDDWYRTNENYSLVSAARSKEGLLYFGGSAGITRVDTKLPLPVNENVKISIEEVKSNGEQISDIKKLVSVSHDNGYISIRFAGQDYDSGPFLKYSYILEGYEKEWTEVNGEGIASYSHLPSGKYRFRARVCNPKGEWSDDEACIDIKVAQKWSSMLLPLLIIYVIIITGTVLLRIRRKESAIASKPAENNCQENVKDVKDSPEKETTGKEAEKINEADKQFFDRIIDRLNSNLENEKYTVNELAKDMGMSYSSLYAKFKSITGVTPQQYMTSHRMLKAEEFLKTGLHSVSEVAYKVGSSSPATFSREFKKYFGYPPSKLPK